MKNNEAEILIKQNWNEKDFEDYRDYLNKIKGDEKNCMWEKRIVNTKLPCMAKSCEKARVITSAILKGNYINFLDNVSFENHIDTLVFAYILNKIKDFEIFKKYLLTFARRVDNWASCDALKHKKRDKQELLKLAQELLKSEFVFSRRIGVNIMFDLITEEYLDEIFSILNLLKNEKEYYVNMSGAWLLCECFVKHRNRTLEFFKGNKTNDFIINKAISKCRDSFRVNNFDKELLKDFKRK